MQDSSQEAKKAAREQFGPKFVKPDPANEQECTARDWSQIPASAAPDYLLKDPAALSALLKMSETSGWNPSMAVGAQTGGAPIMSYGWALHMFGVKNAPGLPDSDDDYSDEEETVLLEDGDAAEKLSDQSQIGGELNAAAVMDESTEKKLDEMKITVEEDLVSSRDTDDKNKSVLTLEEQWAILRSPDIMPHATKLAAQYANLVAEREKKQAAEQAKLVKSQDDAAESVPVPASSADPSAWPEVGRLTFADFTSWVQACKDRQRNFGSESCDAREEERQARKKLMMEKLGAWSESSASGSLKSGIVDPDPRQFWSQPESLGAMDIKAMGLTVKEFNEGGEEKK